MKYLKTLLAAGAMSLASLPAFAQQDITWWDFLSGGDGVRMKALIARFNEEHPDIKINGTTLEWGVPFYTKVRTSVAVGQGPDVMTYHLSRMPLGLEENVLDVISDDDLAAAGLSKDDFFPAAIARSAALRPFFVERPRDLCSAFELPAEAGSASARCGSCGGAASSTSPAAPGSPLICIAANRWFESSGGSAWGGSRRSRLDLTS